MTDLDAQAQTATVQAALSRLITGASAAVRGAFDQAGAFHQRAMAKRFEGYSGKRLGFGSGAIQTRSGDLSLSFGWETRGAGLDLETKMFSAGVGYARIQEHGGTIRPKNKQYLTVPLPDALTAAGLLKGGAKLVQQGGKYVTADGAPTFIFKSKRGNLLIGARPGQDFGYGDATIKRPRNNKIVLLYALRKEVSIRPRLGFRETFEKQTVPHLQALIVAASKRLVG